MITVTVTAATMAEALEQMNIFCAVKATQPAVTPAEPQAEKPAAKKPPAKKAPSADTTPSETEPDERVYTLEDVGRVVPLVLTKIGREELVALLAEFGCTKGGQLTAEQRGPFVQQAEAMLG